MVMDFGHSCNIGYARMLDKSGRLFWVRWYKAAPGAKSYPGWHAFGAPWFDILADDFDGPGIFLEGIEHRPNAYPAPPGQHFRGDPLWFENGLPEEHLAVPPIADTCFGPCIDSEGGVVIGTPIEFSLTVLDSTGAPSYPHILNIQIVQADGFYLQSIDDDTVRLGVVACTSSGPGTLIFGDQDIPGGTKSFHGPVNIGTQIIEWASSPTHPYIAPSAMPYPALTAAGLAIGVQAAGSSGGAGSFGVFGDLGYKVWALLRSDDTDPTSDAAYIIFARNQYYVGTTGMDSLGNKFHGGLCYEVGTALSPIVIDHTPVSGGIPGFIPIVGPGVLDQVAPGDLGIFGATIHVEALQGFPISGPTPTANQLLGSNGSSWMAIDLGPLLAALGGITGDF